MPWRPAPAMSRIVEMAARNTKVVQTRLPRRFGHGRNGAFIPRPSPGAARQARQPSRLARRPPPGRGASRWSRPPRLPRRTSSSAPCRRRPTTRPAGNEYTTWCSTSPGWASTRRCGSCWRLPRICDPGLVPREQAHTAVVAGPAPGCQPGSTGYTRRSGSMRCSIASAIWSNWSTCSGDRASITADRTCLTWPGAAASSVRQPRSVNRVLVARPSSLLALRSTSPRPRAA